MEPLTAFAYKQKLGWDFHTWQRAEV
jgi:hypothetical protein